MGVGVPVSVGVGVAVSAGVDVTARVGVGVPVVEGDGLGVNVGGIKSVGEGDRIMPDGAVALRTIGPKVADGVAVRNAILFEGAIANATRPIQ